MKRCGVLLPMMAFLSLMFPLAVFADLIYEPPIVSAVETVVTKVILPVGIFILVGFLAIVTVVIIYSLIKRKRK